MDSGPSLKTTKDISLLIVTYNSANAITSCLRSIQSAGKGSPAFEIIIVDNASTDTTREIIRGQFPGVALIANNNNPGFAAAVNKGAEAAKGKYLLLLNPDTAVPENFLQRLPDFLQSNSQASVVGVNLVDAKGNHQPSCWKTPGLFTVLSEMFLPYKMSLGLVTDNPALRSEVSMVSGACMAIRKELFDRLHGFDAEYFMYYEDADFCFRARKEGYKIFYNPEIKVLHHAGGSTSDMQLFYERLYTSKLLFFKKNYSAVYSVIVHLIVFLGIIIRIPAYYVAGAVLFNKKLLSLARVHILLLKKLVG